MADNGWKDRGSVLLVVLIVITSVFAILFARGESLIGGYAKVVSLGQTQQGYIYAKTAIRGIMKLLEEDDGHYDTPLEIWAALPVIPTEEGFIRIEIIPLNSRISLYGLLSDDKNIKQRTKRALLSIAPDYGINRWTDAVEYAVPYSLPALRFHNFSETPSEVLGHLTVENTEGRININFADKEAIIAYLPELEWLVKEIIEYRAESPFEDVTQLRMVPGMDDALYLSIQPYITVESRLFYIYIESHVGEVTVSASAIIKRDSITRATEMLKYFEGTEEFYAI